MQAGDGLTALSLTAHNGHSDIVTYLIEAKGDADMHFKDGRC